MKTSRKELKYRARRALLGKYPSAVGITVTVCIVSLIVIAMLEVLILISGGIAQGIAGMEVGILVMAAVLFFGILFLMVLFGMMFPGIVRFYLNLCQGRNAKVSDMLWGIQYYGGKFFGISLLFSLLFGILALPDFVLTAAAVVTDEAAFPLLFLFAYNLLLGIAGLYAGLTYSLFYLILAHDPGKSVTDALRESRQMMKGNRGRMFMLSLSFLGWLVIGYLTMGLGLLWLIPYMGCTYCCFYLDLKEKYSA